MSRHRPSRPVLPSRVPGCRWVRRRVVLLDGTSASFLRLLGAPGWADVHSMGRRWIAVTNVPVLRERDFRTKRDAMRWAERQVKP